MRVVFDSICELFGKTIRNMPRCYCYLLVECCGVVECGGHGSVGEDDDGLPQCVLCLWSQLMFKCSFYRVCLGLFLYVWMFSGLRAGSQVFALLMLFLLFLLHSMWLGKSLHLLCIFLYACLPTVKCSWIFPHCALFFILRINSTAISGTFQVTHVNQVSTTVKSEQTMVIVFQWWPLRDGLADN